MSKAQFKEWSDALLKDITARLEAEAKELSDGDGTTIGKSTWKKVKKQAMIRNYERKDWFVSNLKLSFNMSEYISYS